MEIRLLCTHNSMLTGTGDKWVTTGIRGSICVLTPLAIQFIIHFTWLSSHLSQFTIHYSLFTSNHSPNNTIFTKKYL